MSNTFISRDFFSGSFRQHHWLAPTCLKVRDCRFWVDEILRVAMCPKQQKNIDCRDLHICTWPDLWWRRDLQSLCCSWSCEVATKTQLQAAYPTRAASCHYGWADGSSKFPQTWHNLYHAGIHTHANHFEFWTLALKCTDVLDVFNIDVLSRSWYFWKIWNNKALAASEVKPKRNRTKWREADSQEVSINHFITWSFRQSQISKSV